MGAVGTIQAGGLAAVGINATIARDHHYADPFPSYRCSDRPFQYLRRLRGT